MKPDIEITLWPFSSLDFYYACSVFIVIFQVKVLSKMVDLTIPGSVAVCRLMFSYPVLYKLYQNILRDRGLSSVIARFQLINFFPHQLTLWWEMDGEEVHVWLTNFESYIQSQWWQSGTSTILVCALTILPPGGLQIMVAVVIARLYFQVTSVSISCCRTWSYTPSWGSAMCYLACNVIASYCITRSNLAKMGCPWKMGQLPTEPLKLPHIS